MHLGQAIKFCRQQRNLTQPELAERAGISPSYLSVLEKGKRDPSFSMIEKIARALDIPLSLLIFIATDPSEIQGLPTEVTEKLSAATINLLRAARDENQHSLL
jgi:transcriptional regulator with XRE-family HTH domain